MCQPVTQLSLVFSSVCSHLDLFSNKKMNKKCNALFCLSFSCFSFPSALSPPTFISISSDSFSSSSMCSSVRDTYAVGKVVVGFLGTFSLSVYLLSYMCSAVGRSKGITTELCCEDSCGGGKGTREWPACFRPTIHNGKPKILL